MVVMLVVICERIVLMLMTMVVVVAVVMVIGLAVDPGALALPAAGLLLVDGGAQPLPVLLIPRTQRLAAEHQIVVFNDGGGYPWLARQVHLVGGRVGEVGGERARLRGAAWG
jgi:hypothetical protein